MFEEYKGELHCTLLFSACDNGDDYFAIFNDNSTAFFFDLNTFAPVGAVSVALGADYHYGAFITDTDIVLASTVTNVPKSVNVLTGTLSTLTTQLTCFASGRSQDMIAVDRVNSKAMYPSSTAGKLVTIVPGSPYTTAQISPSGLSGKTFQCAIHKTGSVNFLTGTSDGNVYELSITGTINKTITLPTTPNIGSAAAHPVSSMIYLDSEDILLVATHSGMLFQYTYSTSTLVDVQCLRNMDTISTGGLYLSNVFNRQFIHSCFSRPSDGMIWEGMRITSGGSIPVDQLISRNFLSPYPNIGVNEKHKLFWIACRSSLSTSLSCVKFISISGTAGGAVGTRGQEPANVDVDHRILRLANYGNCNYDLTVDQNVSNGSEDGEVFVDSPIQGAEEIEISVIGTPEVDEAFQARRYTV